MPEDLAVMQLQERERRVVTELEARPHQQELVGRRPDRPDRDPRQLVDLNGQAKGRRKASDNQASQYSGTHFPDVVATDQGKSGTGHVAQVGRSTGRFGVENADDAEALTKAASSITQKVARQS